MTSIVLISYRLTLAAWTTLVLDNDIVRQQFDRLRPTRACAVLLSPSCCQASVNSVYLQAHKVYHLQRGQASGEVVPWSNVLGAGTFRRRERPLHGMQLRHQILALTSSILVDDTFDKFRAAHSQCRQAGRLR